MPSAIDVVQYKDSDGGTIDCKLIPHLMDYIDPTHGKAALLETKNAEAGMWEFGQAMDDPTLETMGFKRTADFTWQHL